jgi:hypothetical protein
MSERGTNDVLSVWTYRAIDAINRVVTVPGADAEDVNAALDRVRKHLNARLAQTATPFVPPTSDVPYDPPEPGDPR